MRYIATGTGHSGTGYVARLLSSAGLRVGHEAVFRANGSKDYHKRVGFDWDGDSSWAAAPFVRDWPEATIIHAVRHPLATIQSLTLNATGGDNHLWQNEHIALELPHTGVQRIRRQTQYWLRWNALIAELRPDALLYRVEDRTALLDRLGLEQTTAWDDNKYNHHGTHDAWTWADLPDDLVGEVKEAAKWMGYDPA